MTSSCEAKVALVTGTSNSAHDDSIRIIHAALDAGINFVDTAGRLRGRRIGGDRHKALKGRRDDVVLPTKVWSPMGEEPNRRGISRRWIIAEVENSLRRLGTAWIDLYQVHRPDPNTAGGRDLVQLPVSEDRGCGRDAVRVLGWHLASTRLSAL